MSYKKNLGANYSPLYFLASLGGGGLSVSVFVYLMFMIKHPKTPLITADTLYPMIMKGNFASFLIVIAFVFIIYFAYLHFKLLIWNISEYKIFKKTQEYKNLKNSNAEVTLMAIPLTFAMTVNVMFVLGATFIPKLWSVVEYLFPFAIIGFLATGYYALKFFGEYFTRFLISGEFDFAQNSNLSQMIAIFAFSMVGVGLAAPGAMAHNQIVSAIGVFTSIFFITIALLLTIIKLTIGFKSMMRHGVKAEMAPSLWIVIPIITLIGIAFFRDSVGVTHNISHSKHIDFPFFFMFLSFMVSMQIVFGFIGYKVMKKLNYFKDYIDGNKKHVGAFSLICPGVAFNVLGMFFIFFGIVKNGIVEIFSIGYFIVLLPYIYIHIKTIILYFKLNAKLLKR